MMGKQFYYWREVAFMILMVVTLLLNLTFFEVLPTFGDEPAMTGGASLILR